MIFIPVISANYQCTSALQHKMQIPVKNSSNYRNKCHFCCNLLLTRKSVEQGVLLFTLRPTYKYLMTYSHKICVQSSATIDLCADSSTAAKKEIFCL